MSRASNSFAEVEASGEFKRTPTSYRAFVRRGGSPFPAARGRYALFVSLACPWATRCLITRHLKGLQAAIDVHVVEPIWGTIDDESGVQSWVFGAKGAQFAGVSTEDPVYASRSMRELYERSDPDYAGRYTVPVLWDKETARIVNNESSEILQMLNSEFDEFAEHPEVDIRPAGLVDEIDALNDSFYNTFNNGVYRAGFATSQAAYSTAVQEVFATLDSLEARLADGRDYLVGGRLTESDVRLFCTLVRFDPVYITHFKCNLRRLVDYPHLWRYTRRLYALPAFADSTNLDHIKHHYFGSHPRLNPSGVVPDGPIIDWSL